MIKYFFEWHQVAYILVFTSQLQFLINYLCTLDTSLRILNTSYNQFKASIFLDDSSRRFWMIPLGDVGNDIYGGYFWMHGQLFLISLMLFLCPGVDYFFELPSQTCNVIK